MKTRFVFSLSGHGLGLPHIASSRRFLQLMRARSLWSHTLEWLGHFWEKELMRKLQTRPWGSHQIMARKNLENGARFHVKHIIVRPGQALSLQTHQHRAEHWVVVAGIATVECDGRITRLHENESAYVPKGAKHRLSNQGKIDLHVVEVASGDYLGEDDIVRHEDAYGRQTLRLIRAA